MSQTMEFYEVLEIIDNFSLDEQDDLINIIKHRQIERRRDKIAQNIDQAREDYQQGNIFRGNVDEIIAELNRDD